MTAICQRKPKTDRQKYKDKSKTKAAKTQIREETRGEIYQYRISNAKHEGNRDLPSRRNKPKH